MVVVGGLQNVSVFDSSFCLESQSTVSRRWGEKDRPSTRASSLLQMWRELEGEHVVSHPNGRFGERLRLPGSETSDSDRVSTQGSVNENEAVQSGRRWDWNLISQHDENDSSEHSGTVENDNGLCSQSLIEPENERKDNNSFCSEQSTDLGQVERERVRQIFREWMNSGVKTHSSNASHRNNRARAQWLGENECERVRIIRERVQMNAQQSGTCDSPSDEGVAEFGSQIEQVRDGQMIDHCEVAERKPIRKLCGRQALLDMLMRAQKERKKEFQHLLERRPVSDFAHRNRIQSLLRGRFLLNRRLIQDERPAASTATRELGLLRQRNTVSDLREGFLSKRDRSSVHDIQSDGSSNDEHDDHRHEQSQSSNEQEVQAEVHNHSEPCNAQREFNGIDTVGNLQSNAVEDVNQQDHDASVIEAQEQVLEDEGREQETSSTERISSRRGREDDATGSWRENNPDEWSHRIYDSKETLQTHLLESHEMYNENDAQSIDVTDVHEAESRTIGFEGSMTEEFALHGMPAQAEEWQESVTEYEEDDLQQFVSREISEWTEVNGEDIGGSWQEGIANQWYQETSGNDVGVQNHLQESDGEWHENAQEEAIDSWLDVPSGREADSVGRVDSFYFPDEDNTHSTELRQLLSRRRVSTLLHSGFRESLDQLIQSYVQRQNNASVDWELDESLSSIEHDQEQQHGNQELQEPSWNQELQDSNWPTHDPHQHIGNEWEIVNELRIDMARLHQRMNNMQRMLEACMDMQLELQRSVRQEVSAALNRSVISADACKDHLPMDDSKWDHVRKGICCMCSEKNIDSLLYRCGHMCTCSKCAEELVQGGKCPMCSAPVIEVIRSYFIQ